MKRSPPSPARAAVLFEQLRGGSATAETLEWLAHGFELFDRHDGRIALHRLLGLGSRAARLRQRRDFYIAEAAELLGPGAPHPVAERLGRELDAFARADWPRWRELESAPYGTAPLRVLLHQLLRACDGGVRPCDKRLAQVIAAAREKFSS